MHRFDIGHRCDRRNLVWANRHGDTVIDALRPEHDLAADAGVGQ